MHFIVLLLSCLITLATCQQSAIITNVEIVTSDSKEGAFRACHQFGSHYQIAGFDLNRGSRGKFIYICYEKRQKQALHKRALVDVLAVINKEKCLPTYEKLQSGVNQKLWLTEVYLCVKYDQFDSSQAISDLSVSTTRGFDGGPKWRSVPVDLNKGVGGDFLYLHLRSGLEMVVDFIIIKEKDQAQALNKCLMKPGFRVAGIDINKGYKNDYVYLCYRSIAKKHLAPTEKVLTKLAVTVGASRAVQCPSGLSRYDFDLNKDLGGKFIYLCFRYETLSAASSVIQNILITEDNDNSLPFQWYGTNNQNLHPGVPSIASNYLRYSATSELVFKPQLDEENPELKARKTATGYKFKILQLADLHFTAQNYVGEQNAKVAYMNSLLEKEKPDFVVFTGDNTEESFGKDFEAISFYSKAVAAKGIPWSMVFGNHDDEGKTDRSQLLRLAGSIKGSKSLRGPLSVNGVGNYVIKVKQPDMNQNDILRLYFLDSGAYVSSIEKARMKNSKCTPGSYDWIKYSQVEYYRYWAEKFAQEDLQHRIKRVPALMFFHIPLIEYWEFTGNDSGVGVKHEKISSPTTQSGLFQELVEGGDVKATFVGHDHINTFCHKREGINLCFGGGSGNGRAYTKNWFTQRARLIEFEKNADKEMIRSWKILDNKSLTKVEQETIYDNS